MTISDAINNAKNKINNAYESLKSIGASMPQIKDLYNLATTIEEVPQVTNLVNWTYSGNNGTLNLESYTGDFSSTVKVPYVVGVYINNLPESTSFLDYYNVPFYRNEDVTSVDLNHVPFRENSMKSTFWNCFNLISVTNISPNVNSMESTFGNCTSFNSKVQIPNNVSTMYMTFRGCTNFNQPLTIPNSVVNAEFMLDGCINFNAPVQIGSSVESMYLTFSNCSNFNQPITIPNSVTDLNQTFRYCTNLNQNIQIPASVTNMDSTFYNCSNFSKNVVIFSRELSDATNCFSRYTVPSYNPPPFSPKNVYIPYNYIGTSERTKTFNAFQAAGYIKEDGSTNSQHGVTVYDLNEEQQDE